MRAATRRIDSDAAVGQVNDHGVSADASEDAPKRAGFEMPEKSTEDRKVLSDEEEFEEERFELVLLLVSGIILAGIIGMHAANAFAL